MRRTCILSTSATPCTSPHSFFLVDAERVPRYRVSDGQESKNKILILLNELQGTYRPRFPMLQLLLLLVRTVSPHIVLIYADDLGW